ncbi:MAG: hypothetical protein IK053_03810, partial [Muribaculaceae bacterium]|nr:hypothetical protein [Muribaculaceae bacterium]
HRRRIFRHQRLPLRQAMQRIALSRQKQKPQTQSEVDQNRQKAASKNWRGYINCRMTSKTK